MLSHQLKGEIKNTSDKPKSIWYAAHPWIQCFWANQNDEFGCSKAHESDFEFQENFASIDKTLSYDTHCGYIYIFCSQLWMAQLAIDLMCRELGCWFSSFLFSSLVKVLFSFLELRFAWFQYWFAVYGWRKKEIGFSIYCHSTVEEGKKSDGISTIQFKCQKLFVCKHFRLCIPFMPMKSINCFRNRKWRRFQENSKNVESRKKLWWFLFSLQRLWPLLCLLNASNGCVSLHFTFLNAAQLHRKKKSNEKQKWNNMKRNFNIYFSSVGIVNL